MAELELQAEITVKDALLKQAKSWARSPDPMLRIAAAREELVLTQQLTKLRKRQARRKQKEAAAE